jgi:hypothetical protein
MVCRQVSAAGTTHRNGWEIDITLFKLHLTEKKAANLPYLHFCVRGLTEALRSRGQTRPAAGKRRAYTGRIKVSDNPLEPGPQDYDKVNVNVESDIEYWSRELGISRARLAEVIEAVGPLVLDIRRRLASAP